MYPNYEVDYWKILIIVGQLALIISLPAAAAVVWQRRNRASWKISLFAVAAFAVNYAVVRIPLWRELHEALILPLSPYLGIMNMNGFLGFWVLEGFVYGLLRIGILWLMFRYAATNIRSWRLAVLFGLCYSSIAVLFRVGEYAYDLVERYDLFQYSLQVALSIFGDNFPPLRWWEVLLLAGRWAVVLTAFNVGTSLAVLFSVQRRSVLLLLVAVLWYVVYVTSPSFTFHNFHGLEVGGIHSFYMNLFLPLLVQTLVTLLPFLLLLPMRKTKSQGET